MKMKMEEVKTWLDALKYTLERKCVVCNDEVNCAFCQVANEMVAMVFASSCERCPVNPRGLKTEGVYDPCPVFWRKIRKPRRIKGAEKILKELEKRPRLGVPGIRRLIIAGLTKEERKDFGGAR